jgi:putative alpha-1,2-mannosidase
MHGLIARHGGPAAFIRHLNHFFRPDNRHPWKEIVLHLPYLYVYAGRPDLTSKCARSQMQQHYRLERNGLDDNEDMGCQSAFYMCSALGMYPIMGQDIYILSTPVFSRSEIALGRTGKTLAIEAPGADDEQVYIKSATLNGKPLDRAWVRHSEIENGGVLRYELATTPGEWGARDVPPSPSV